MKSLSIIGAFIILTCTIQGQGRVALTPATAAHASSILDLRTTVTAAQQQGFLMTRVDESQRLSIASPANALWVFQNKEARNRYFPEKDFPTEEFESLRKSVDCLYSAGSALMALGSSDQQRVDSAVGAELGKSSSMID